MDELITTEEAYIRDLEHVVEVGFLTTPSC